MAPRYSLVYDNTLYLIQYCVQQINESCTAWIWKELLDAHIWGTYYILGAFWSRSNVIWLYKFRCYYIDCCLIIPTSSSGPKIRKCYQSIDLHQFRGKVEPIKYDQKSDIILLSRVIQGINVQIGTVWFAFQAEWFKIFSTYVYNSFTKMDYMGPDVRCPQNGR